MGEVGRGRSVTDWSVSPGSENTATSMFTSWKSNGGVPPLRMWVPTTRRVFPCWTAPAGPDELTGRGIGDRLGHRPEAGSRLDDEAVVGEVPEGRRRADEGVAEEPDHSPVGEGDREPTIVGDPPRSVGRAAAHRTPPGSRPRSTEPRSTQYSDGGSLGTGDGRVGHTRTGEETDRRRVTPRRVATPESADPREDLENARRDKRPPIATTPLPGDACLRL